LATGGRDGYAFANVNANPISTRKSARVSFTFLIDPAARLRRRISVVGNTRTRDEVVRREMRQQRAVFRQPEAAALQAAGRQDGLFSEVEVETPRARHDRSGRRHRAGQGETTGAVLLGVGFSNVDKFIVQASVQQSNFFGTGNTVGVQVATGSVNKVASFPSRSTIGRRGERGLTSTGAT